MLLTILLFGELLGIAGHPVGCRDLASHIYRLLQGDDRRRSVPGVKCERLANLSADGVDRGGDVHALGISEQFLQCRVGHHLLEDDRVGENGSELVTEILLENGAGAGELRRRLVTNQLQVLIGIHIGAGRCNLRKIVGRRNLAVVTCDLDFLSGSLEGVAVVERHLPAVVKCQHLLSLSAKRKHRKCACKNDDGSFHFYRFVVSVFFRRRIGTQIQDSNSLPFVRENA